MEDCLSCKYLDVKSALLLLSSLDCESVSIYLISLYTCSTYCIHLKPPPPSPLPPPPLPAVNSPRLPRSPGGILSMGRAGDSLNGTGGGGC